MNKDLTGYIIHAKKLEALAAVLRNHDYRLDRMPPGKRNFAFLMARDCNVELPPFRHRGC